VRFICPTCRQLLGISVRKAGAQVNCPKCHSAIIVPPADSGSVETEADSAHGDAVWAEGGTAEKLPSTAPPLSGLVRAATEWPREPSDGAQFIRLPRRVLYLQAILLAVVALLAFAAGYLIGSGTRLSGP
jgi:DNA-directed RNA polymerase subunit RPC12/RpoP